MSQNMEILQALKDGKMITPLDALHDYGCFRLAARVYDLRKKGYDIRTAVMTDHNYATYYLKR